ncbi:DEAD/DEAH box helicase [Mucilaginibacter aquaedulcis]|uniref:DEAD/DEAH box helicase n=1 Tax=Mucilaginibacter aquaedulcis TaxID=1187081 RepID=UPI0025B2B615|nr:DEAD/DEAH box helicase [Mucilaginibacter aquaedulcis]MDN3550500.1 DEAD/DEAH box helicase [Mucilaginibacter aquaedulcis]
MEGNEELLNEIALHPVLNQVIDDLTYNQFFYRVLGQPQKPIMFDDLRKAIWLASILAQSRHDDQRNKAQLISSLIYLNNVDSLDYMRVAYVLFSRLGNLTGAKLLRNNQINLGSRMLSVDRPTKVFDPALTMEMEIERFDSSILTSDNLIAATRFQRSLWDKLEANNHLAISGPTSSGKSFVIKKFISAKLSSVEEYSAVYIVPSRALINQVSEDLRNEVDLSTVSIKTVFIQDDVETPRREIFILTPERCLRLLKMRWLTDFKIDFIFVDEIQNVEDTQGRGSLFEFVFNELAVLFPNAKVVAAGPNIDAPAALYGSVFGPNGQIVETTVSPVFQIKTTVKPLKNNLEVSISSTLNRFQTRTIATTSNFAERFRKNVGDGLQALIGLCSKEGDQNIIYCPKGNLATDWAKLFAASRAKSDDIDPGLRELIEFVEDEIHPLYQLIPCLYNQTAYHHGNLPEIIRKEIEDCFLDGSIKNLFCTTTLLQGVNLPANNLFIPDPHKRNIKLSPFDFGNLIGRAGRIKDSLYGTIYCIERGENEWSQELYHSPAKKVVKTAGEIALEKPDELLFEINRETATISHKQQRSAAVFFLQKYLRSPEELNAYLTAKNLSQTEIERLEAALQKQTADIEIPRELLKLNPTIDPLLQDELFRQILQDGVEHWVIYSATENKNFHDYIEPEDKALWPYSEWTFYLQLESVIVRLNEIFKMTSESYWKYGIGMSARQLALNAYHWLQNKSIHEIIERDLEFHKTHRIPEERIDPSDPKDVNKRIGIVIKTNSVVVTHILVKYLKLLNDLLEPQMSDEQKVRFKFSLALPTMLELGTTQNVVIALISRGVSRSIALKVFAEYEKERHPEGEDVFTWLATKDRLPLKPIYNRYLKRMRLLRYEKPKQITDEP